MHCLRPAPAPATGAVLAAAVALAVGAGCTRPPPATCRDDRNCEAGEACIDGRCTVLGGCVSSDDCPPGRSCEQGVCVEGGGPCARDADCPRDTWCNVLTGRCVASPPDGGRADGGGSDGGGGPGDGGQGGCSSDFDCRPPDRICEQGTCVDGCTLRGCAGSERCDPATGRCGAAPATCSGDADCDPPRTICEAQTCVAGCLTSGCTAPLQCQQSTGRCEAPPPGCTSAQDCPPERPVCSGGQCVAEPPPDCTQTGCAPDEVCSASTGLCQARGTTPLGGSCTTHAECESNYCLILSSGSGLCVRTCSASHQCPIDFVCRNIAPPQTTFCIHESLVGKDFGPDPSGTFCSDTVNRCHSGWCWIPQTSCTDTCQHDRDCQVAGRICQLFIGDFDGNGIDEMVTVCAPPSNGSGATGSACTANSQCLRGNCLSAGYCGDPCCRASDCPSGYTCEPVSGAGGSVIKACARTPGVGSAPVGTPCDPANDLFCRSNYCWEDGPGDPYCTDTCCSDSDCPEGFRCQSWPFDLDGDQVPDLSWPLCLRR